MTIDPNAFAVAAGQGLVDSEPVVFAGGTVVQLANGDASSPDAIVVDLHAASVTVTDTAITAVDSDIAWSWVTADLQAVVHADEEPWTIFVVPGIADFGVSVPPSRVDEFRQAIARVSPVAPVRQDSLDEPVSHAVLVPPAVANTPAMVDADAVTGPVPLIITEAPVGGAVSIDAQIVPAPTQSITLSTPSEFPSASRFRLLRSRDRQVAQTVSASAAETGVQAPLAGIDARNISAWFGPRQVLDRVSLDMVAGQVTALIGPSGCGKSTFLRILNRMHEMIPGASMAGEVLVDGHDLYDVNRKLTDARREIGMVFQKPNPFPAMSIYDNVLASYRLTGVKASVAAKDEVVEACLSKAGLWAEVRDRLRQPGGGLSGGQQQRLCIARALAIRPRVLLMDEPCSALDPTSTRRIEETVMELSAEVTIVIVTHNMQQAARVSNQCAFFLAEQGTPGVIVEHGPTSAMFGSPQDPRTNDYVMGRFG